MINLSFLKIKADLAALTFFLAGDAGLDDAVSLSNFHEDAQYWLEEYTRELREATEAGVPLEGD